MKLKPIVAVAFFLASALVSRAALIYDSGLDGTTFSTFGVIGTANTGKAVGFSLGTTGLLGATGYSLTSITVRLNNPRATNILSSDYTFSLWSSDATPKPAAQLATFTSVSLTANSTANYALTISAPFTLQPSTSYWIVAQSTLTDGGAGTTLPAWLGTGGTATVAAGVSQTTPVGRFGTTGTPDTWTSSSGLANDLQINATAVPEPTTAAAMLLGGLCILMVLRRGAGGKVQA